METNNKPLFKMLITLNGKVDPARFAHTIEKMLACYNTYGEKEIDDNTIEFGFSNPKYFGGMMGVIMDVYESGLRAYISEFIWVDCSDNTYEDILEELAKED